MKQKVAAYCRVSTDSSDQANSLASQEKYFRDYIERNPQWELAQVYVDTGITGTSIRKRVAFNQMISEALSGKFSLILTKEISRFARNTLDSIYYTRKLREHGIGVIFMNDNINTLDPDAELRLTIMSSIAQEESRKTSDRVKWGQKRRMEQGVVFGRDLLGYDVRGGRLYVNEEGAGTVRLIFQKFVSENKSAHTIARELQEAGIRTSTYMKQWSGTVILRILRNEKYCGDLVQKKTFTPDYLNHEKKYNKGEEKFVIIRDHHEPIISRELFDRAQRVLERRSLGVEHTTRHSGRYCFSGKIKCGICGSTFVSRTKKRKDGSIYRAWRCYRAVNYGSGHIDKAGNRVGCDCPSLNDDELKRLMMGITESLSLDRDKIIRTVRNIVTEVRQIGKQADQTGIVTKIEDITKKRQGLIELYLANDISKDEFFQMKEKYEYDMEGLMQRAVCRTQKDALQDNSQEDWGDMNTYISGLITGEIWDDTFYRNLLDTITVTEDNTLTVTLNCMS